MNRGMLTVGGVDVYDAARFIVEDVQGLDPWPARDTALLNLFGRDGALIANERRTVAPRTIRVTGFVDGAGGTLTTRLDALADLLERADLVLQFPARRSGVNYTANLDGPRGTIVPSPTFRQPGARVEFVFVCAQPYGEDETVTIVSGAEDIAHACNIGTAPSDPYIKITGPAVNPTIIHKDSGGVEIGRMAFTLTLVDAADFLHIRGADGGFATKDLGAGEVSAMDDLAAGYTFPELRPEYGDRAAADYQTIETDDGDITIEFFRRWL